jgi:hypothetical protein
MLQMILGTLPKTQMEIIYKESMESLSIGMGNTVTVSGRLRAVVTISEPIIATQSFTIKDRGVIVVFKLGDHTVVVTVTNNSWVYKVISDNTVLTTHTVAGISFTDIVQGMIGSVLNGIKAILVSAWQLVSSVTQIPG